MAKKKSNSEVVDMPEVDDTTLNKGKVNNDYSTLVEGDGGYNPFKEEVIERDYTRPKVDTSSLPPIPEPSFEPPNLEDFSSGVSDEDMGTDKPESDHPFTTEDLSDKEKKIACENIVDTFLGAYGLLHEWGYKWVSVTEEQVTEHAMNGDIDLSLEYPLSTERNITFGEFCESYNDQVKDILSVDDEFVQDVRPRLIRIAMKHDFGMTDEQYCIYKFSVDIAQKGGAIYSFKKQMKMTIEHLSKLTKDFKSNNPQQNTPPPTPPSPTPEEYVQPNVAQAGDDITLEEEPIYLEPEEKMNKNQKKKSNKTSNQGKTDLLPPDADIIKETEEK